jgi:hypothetical protein
MQQSGQLWSSGSYTPVVSSLSGRACARKGDYRADRAPPGLLRQPAVRSCRFTRSDTSGRGPVDTSEKSRQAQQKLLAAGGQVAESECAAAVSADAVEGCARSFFQSVRAATRALASA